MDQDTENHAELAKKIAAEMHEATKASRRPWWLSWGIPLVVFALLSWLSSEVYYGLKEGQAAQAKAFQDWQEKSSETDSLQNESLAVTAQVLRQLRADSIELKLGVASAKKDPYTGQNALADRTILLRRIDRNELRLDAV